MKKRLLATFISAITLSFLLIGLPRTNNNLFTFPADLRIELMSGEKLPVDSKATNFKVWNSKMQSLDQGYQFALQILKYADKPLLSGLSGSAYSLKNNAKKDKMLRNSSGILLSDNGEIFSLKRNGKALQTEKLLYSFDNKNINKIEDLRSFIKSFKNSIQLESNNGNKQLGIDYLALQQVSELVTIVTFDKFGNAINPALSLTSKPTITPVEPAKILDQSSSVSTHLAVFAPESSSAQQVELRPVENNKNISSDASPHSFSSATKITIQLPRQSSSSNSSAYAAETYKCCAGINENNNCCAKKEADGSCKEYEKKADGSYLSYIRYNGYWMDTEGKACSEVSGYSYEVPKGDGGTKEKCTEYEEYNRETTGCSAICNLDNLCPESTYPD